MTPPPVGSVAWFIGNIAAAIVTYFLFRYWLSRARKEEHASYCGLNSGLRAGHCTCGIKRGKA